MCLGSSQQQHKENWGAVLARMLRLQCFAQNYEWGRTAEESEVASLAKANGNDIDASKPFAELWMGTHPKCPSRLADSGRALQEVLTQHPEQLLGARVVSAFGAQLPFLFKVLSVAKALSIQAHPDKALARQLHARAPHLYPDDNHKPEMALALGPQGMEALCGFVPLHQLQHHLAAVPELAECVGEAPTQALLALEQPDKQVLRDAFTSLMECDRARVEAAVGRLVHRLSHQQQAQAQIQLQGQAQQPAVPVANGNGHAAAFHDHHHHEHQHQQQPSGQPGHDQTSAPGPLCNGHSNSHGRGKAPPPLPPERVELALRLAGQFPGDVGVLASFFLNLVHLPGGHALALGANEPHAYLSGQLVECMATSDNVMRAGLTPKPLDVPSLVGALTYEQGVPEVMSGSPSGLPGLSLYRPPFHEFEVHRLVLPPGGSTDLPASEGPRLLLLQHGDATLTAMDHPCPTTASAASTAPQPSTPSPSSSLPAANTSPSSAESAWPGLGQMVPELQGEVLAARGTLVFVAPRVALRAVAGPSGAEAWIAAVNSAFFAVHEAAEGLGVGTASPTAAMATL